VYAICKHFDELGSGGHKVTTTRSAHAGVATSNSTQVERTRRLDV